MFTFTRGRWFRTGAGVALASLVVPGAIALRLTAQTPVPTQTPAAPARTTAAGVYSAAQAERGERTFGNICQGCHTTGAYTTAKFRDTWDGRPLAELFQLISETMPEDAPGQLEAGEYAQVVAYLLKLNRVPEGKNDLPSTVAALKAITIAFGSSPAASEGRQP